MNIVEFEFIPIGRRLQEGADITNMVKLKFIPAGQALHRVCAYTVFCEEST